MDAVAAFIRTPRTQWYRQEVRKGFIIHIEETLVKENIQPFVKLFPPHCSMSPGTSCEMLSEYSGREAS